MCLSMHSAVDRGQLHTSTVLDDMVVIPSGQRMRKAFTGQQLGSGVLEHVRFIVATA